MDFFNILNENAASSIVSPQRQQSIINYIKLMLVRVGKDVPNFKNSFLVGQAIIRHLPGSFETFTDGEKDFMFKKMGELIKLKNKNFNPVQARMAWDSTYGFNKFIERDGEEVQESLNPYMKYTKDHPNQQGHHHSLRRTVGNDTDRKSLTMIPKVRKNLKTPYKSKVVNKAQSTATILTPLEKQQIENDYGIDFGDRRVKTVKGKTNMVLTPLASGGWKLERK